MDVVWLQHFQILAQRKMPLPRAVPLISGANTQSAKIVKPKISMFSQV
jgi:hypothetical protein